MTMTMTNKPKFKGIGLRNFLDWVEARHGPEAREEAISPLSAEEHGELVVVLPSKWYPVAIADKIWRHYAETHLPGDRREQARAFRDLGRHIADDNLESIYRIMMSAQEPTTVVHLLPTLWKSYFDGTEVEVEHDEEAGTVTLRINGLGGLGFISPVTCGWLEHAYHKLGSTRCQVQEQSWDDGMDAHDTLVFIVSWQ